MPTYEYQCTSCGHQLESFQKMTDAPLTECPNCHKSTLNKLVSAPAFQLKGTGWYATDFRDKGKPKPKETEGGDTSAGGETKASANDTTTKDSKTTETKTTETKTKTNSSE